MTYLHIYGIIISRKAIKPIKAIWKEVVIMENLKLYYYVNVDSSNQIFAEVEVNNFSEI